MNDVTMMVRGGNVGPNEMLALEGEKALKFGDFLEEELRVWMLSVLDILLLEEEGSALRGRILGKSLQA